jgi:hypothetical protein
MSLLLVKPIIEAMRVLGQRVWVDDESGDGTVWLDIGELCVVVKPERGYGLYLDHLDALDRGPDQMYPFDQLDALLERLRGLVPHPVLRKPA